MKPSAPLMLCCAMVLSGCAAFAPQTPIAAVPPATDPAVKLLTEAASRAERALSALAPGAAHASACDRPAAA